MRPYGLGIGLNMIRSLATQAQRDANAYAALLLANGGTDIASNGEKANLLAFATALYALAGRVDFWPLRSSQNMGTGATAYSFQGVTGTLNGSMSWQTGGLLAPAGGGSFFCIPSYAAALCANPVTSMTVCKMAGTAWSSDIYFVHGNQYGVSTNQNSGGWLRAAAGVGVLNQMRNSTIVNAASFTDNVFALFANTTTGDASNNSVTYKNGAAPNTATVSTTITPATSGASSYRVGEAGGTTSYGTAAFHLVTPQGWDASKHAALYAAYKATLASGLALP